MPLQLKKKMELKQFQGYLVKYKGKIEFLIIVNIFGRHIYTQNIQIGAELDDPISVLNSHYSCSHYTNEEWEPLEKCLITEDVRYFQNQHLEEINTFFGMQGASTLAFKVPPKEHFQNLRQFNKLTTEGGRWLPVDENSSWYEDLPISHPQRVRNKYPETLKKPLLLPEETDELKTVIYSTNIGLIFLTSYSMEYFRVSIRNKDNRPTLFLGLPVSTEDFAKIQKGGILIAAIPQAFMPSEIQGQSISVKDIKPVKVKPSRQHMLPSWHPQYQNRYMQLSEIKVGEYYASQGAIKKLIDVREGPLDSNKKVYKETMIVELETLIDEKPQLEFMNLHYFRLTYMLVPKDNRPQGTAKPTPILLAEKKLKDRTYSKDKYIPEKPKTIIEWHMS